MFISLVVELFICIQALLQACDAENCNVDFHSGLAARTECFTTFGECGFDSLQARHPTLYNKTGWRRDPPSNIKLTSFCEPNSSGVNHSGINVQWNLPNSQSAAGIDGYELRVEGDPPNFRCLVVILEEKATPKNIHLVLNSTMYPVRRNQNYMIVLHSLPRANNSEPESKHVLSMNCKRGSTSSNWVPAGHNYSYKWPEKMLVVWFPAPPSNFNISRFKLNLFPMDNGKTHFETISNTTKVRFIDVEPGKYILYMEPHNEHPHDRDLCVCRDDESRCKSCQLSEWHIEVEIPKSPSTASTGQSYGIIVGVPCATVAIAMLVFILYKYLAKRFGIECVIGKSNKSEKDGVLHVLCIDGSSSRQEASKLRFFLENELNTSVKFNRITAMPHEDISSKMSTLWKKLKIETSSADLGNSVVINKPDVSILICLLISDISCENFSELLSKVQSNLPRIGPLRFQIFAVTFTDNIVTSQYEAVKCFSLNVNQQKFLNAVKKAFPKQTKSEDASIVYTCGKENSGLATQNADKTNKRSGVYVALTKPKTENTGCGLGQKDKVVQGSNHRLPEVTYLGVSEQRRERYVSNDSGRGGSVLSDRHGHSPDDLSGLWQETSAIPSEMEYREVQSKGQKGGMIKYQLTETDCPSCDISFFPPDPSVISENDIDLNAINYDAVDPGNDNVYSIQNLNGRKCMNCMNGLTKTNTNSMDSLMDKMAQINERSALILQQDSHPGEVHSVWEGHV